MLKSDTKGLSLSDSSPTDVWQRTVLGTPCSRVACQSGESVDASRGISVPPTWASWKRIRRVARQGAANEEQCRCSGGCRR